MVNIIRILGQNRKSRLCRGRVLSLRHDRFILFAAMIFAFSLIALNVVAATGLFHIVCVISLIFVAAIGLLHIVLMIALIFVTAFGLFIAIFVIALVISTLIGVRLAVLVASLVIATLFGLLLVFFDSSGRLLSCPNMMCYFPSVILSVSLRVKTHVSGRSEHVCSGIRSCLHRSNPLQGIRDPLCRAHVYASFRQRHDHTHVCVRA